MAVHARILAVFAVCGAVLSCQRLTAPTSRLPPGASNAAVSLRTTVLEPPAPLRSIGQRARITLTAFYSDGTSRDVSAEAAWTSDFSDVIAVNAGELTALAFGVSSISTRFNGMNSLVTAEATPVGTTTATGGAREPGMSGLPGVTVSSARSGAVAMTRSDGLFSIGALVDRDLLFEKPGYENASMTLGPSDHPWIALQRILELGPGGATGGRIAPHDMDYVVAAGRCNPCKLIHLRGAAGLRLRITVRWTPVQNAPLLLWTDDGVFGASSPGEIVRDMMTDSNDARIYVGHQFRIGALPPYVDFTLAAVALVPASLRD